MPQTHLATGLKNPEPLNRHAFPGAVIHDVQRAKGSTIRQRVEHEIHRPPLARLARSRQRQAFGARQALTAPPAYMQTSLPKYAMHPLVIRDHALPRDQHMQPAVAIARADRRVGLQPSQQVGVVHAAAAPIAPRRGAQPDQPAGPTQARMLRVNQPPHRVAPRAGPYHFFATTAPARATAFVVAHRPWTSTVTTGRSGGPSAPAPTPRNVQCCSGRC